MLNGQPYTGEIDAFGAYVVCCDGAYGWARGKVKIDENVGDFDSLPYIPTPPPEKIYPSEKNFTDGEIALFRLIDKGAAKIEIYGGGGKRENHFLGNLHLLYAAQKRGVAAEIITDGAKIFAGSGKISLNNIKGKTLSVLPFGGDAHIMGSAGLKYAYPEKLCYGECRGISNIATDNAAYVEVADGDTVLIIINRGAV